MTCYLFHHNYLKPFRINRRDRVYATHAQGAGLDAGLIGKEMYQLFTRRAFFTRQSLDLPAELTRRAFFTRQSLDLPAELLWRRAYQTPKKFSWDPLPAFVLAS